MNRLAVRNPRSGEIDYHIEDMDSARAEGIAAGLRKAQGAWQQAGVEYRCAQLRQWAAAIEAHRQAITDALCIDTGRRSFAALEVEKVLQLIAHWCERAPQLLAEAGAGVSAQVPTVHYQHRLIPYPLVGVISPWNVPLILGLIDALPALAAGCAVLIKPSEVTPRFAGPLADTLSGVEGLQDVLGFLSGGPQTGAALIDCADAICFTGSVPTGRLVAEHAARRFIPAFLELGGKDPAIVCADADLDNAATAVVRSAIGMTGQACQSLERVYVDQRIYPEFRDRVVARAAVVEMNHPDINRGQIGPLIFARQAGKIRDQLNDAVAKGGRILCGGEIEEHGGYWCQPTVLENIRDDMLLMREETFGPLIPLIPFATEDEAIRRANDSEFGLSAAVFSADTERAIAIAEQLQVGAVSINDASLTGVVNDVEKNSFCLSGIGGSRMGDSGFRRFLRKRALMIQTVPALPIAIFSEAGPEG